MGNTFAGHDLGQALMREGLLPPECTLVELHMDTEGTVQLHYHVNVRADDIPRLARGDRIAGQDEVRRESWWPTLCGSGMLER